jgi:hypothetical protein
MDCFPPVVMALVRGSGLDDDPRDASCAILRELGEV